MEVYFRAGVGLLVVNRDGLVLVGERADVPGAWQAPQGGLRPSEDPIEAAQRELKEETGISWSDVTLVAEYPEWLAYELPPESRSPKTGRGQVQRWFLLRYENSTGGIDVSSTGESEFAAWKWMAADELAEQTWSVRRNIYLRLISAWKDHLT